MLAAEKRQYKAGMAARKREDGASACPFGLNQMRLRSWWLAGWHDADMEVKKLLIFEKRPRHCLQAKFMT